MGPLNKISAQLLGATKTGTDVNGAYARFTRKDSTIAEVFKRTDSKRHRQGALRGSQPVRLSEIGQQPDAIGGWPIARISNSRFIRL